MTRLLSLAALTLVVTSATPAAAQSRDLASYSLLAGSELRASGVTVVSGDVGVNDGQLLASRPLDAPTSKIVAGSMRLNGTSRCSQLYANDLLYPTGSACGPSHSFTSPIFADLGAACGMPASFPACGGAPVTVMPGTARELAPGTYGDVVVMGGGGNPGTLVFTGGEYRICSLRASRHAQVFVRSASTVYVRNAFNLSNGSFAGPTSAGVSPCDFQVIMAGTRMHVSRNASLKARVCAPGAALYVSSGTTLQGGFAAGRMRLGRVSVTGTGCRAGGGTTTTLSSTTTTRPSSTTTTLPAVCGNGHREGTEECDGADLGGATCASLGLGTGTLHCRVDCTFDRLGCTCGNGAVDESTGEQCDPSVPTATCPTHQVCGTAGSADACMCIPSGATVQEICGNCIDDDGNGLTDFEDPACCPTGRGFSLTLRRGRIRSAGGNLSKLRLKAILAQHGLEGINPLKEDVFLQIRPEGGADVFCARIPAGKWTKGKRTFKFKDRKHTVASAQGLDVVKIKVKAKKGVRLRTRARQAKLKTPSQGRLQVTVGFHDGTAGDAQNRCTSTVAQFRTGRKGRLKAP